METGCMIMNIAIFSNEYFYC